MEMSTTALNKDSDWISHFSVDAHYHSEEFKFAPLSHSAMAKRGIQSFTKDENYKLQFQKRKKKSYKNLKEEREKEKVVLLCVLLHFAGKKVRSSSMVRDTSLSLFLSPEENSQLINALLKKIRRKRS